MPEIVESNPLETTVFNPNLFESLTRIAKMLARSSLIPDTLRTEKGEDLPIEKVEANCFLVTEQAYRWGLSPFAVIGCASVVYGRLMWEGKLVHAVVEAKLGVRLNYEYNGKTGDALGVTVYGTLSGEDQPRTVEGTVGQWKTTSKGSPWTSPADHPRQLRYRGAREWARAHAPATILGVITDDEAVDFQRMKRAEIEVASAKAAHNPFEKKQLPGGTRIKPGGKAEAPAPAQKQVDPEPGQESGAEPEHPWVSGMLSDVATSNARDKVKNETVVRYSCELFVDGKTMDVVTFEKDLGVKAQELVGAPVRVMIQPVPGRGVKMHRIERETGEGGEALV